MSEDRWDTFRPAGGTPIRLCDQYGKTTAGQLFHPGNHPAFGGHVRWGQLADGRPWVACTFLVDQAEWVFSGPGAQDAADHAVAGLQALRDDARWVSEPLD